MLVRLARLVVLTTALIGCLSCSGVRHPATASLSIEGKLAVYGRQVTVAATGGAQAVDKLIDGGILDKQTGLAVLGGFKILGVELDRLGRALVIVDDAHTELERTAGLRQVAAIIKAAQRSVTDLVIPVNDPKARAAVVAILQQIHDALIALALQAPAPPGQPDGPPIVWQSSREAYVWWT
jgi:hypothetical protein